MERINIWKGQEHFHQLPIIPKCTCLKQKIDLDDDEFRVSPCLKKCQDCPRVLLLPWWSLGKLTTGNSQTMTDPQWQTISPPILPSLYPLSLYSFSLLLSLPLSLYPHSYSCFLTYFSFSLLHVDLFTKRQIDGICDVCARVQKNKKELEVGNKEVTHGEMERESGVGEKERSAVERRRMSSAPTWESLKIICLLKINTSPTFKQFYWFKNYTRKDIPSFLIMPKRLPKKPIDRLTDKGLVVD